MKERPILFAGEMVRAILAGRKTVTRRLLRTDDAYNGATWVPYQGRWVPSRDELCRGALDAIGPGVPCPHGIKGDRLWVREAFGLVDGVCHYDGPPSKAGEEWQPVYRADGGEGAPPRWFPGIHMPRRVSRVTLEVESVGVERLQDITEEDARAEGVEIIREDDCWSGTHRLAFEYLWGQLNGFAGEPRSRGPWSSNPWVWRVSFRVLSPRPS